jgi:hypothetical protein
MHTCCQMSAELVKNTDTREYVTFIMGCDLHEHAQDLRKIAALKAQYVRSATTRVHMHVRPHA